MTSRCVDGGPCGPAPCRGECDPRAGEEDARECEGCSVFTKRVWADIVTDDGEAFCSECAYRYSAQVAYVLYANPTD